MGGGTAGGRLICPQWPEEYGGKGLDAVRVAVFNEELYRAGVPRVTRGMGESLVGPSIIVHGTPEQQAYFLPRIISGEDVYCQGFSEPGTGSDLAAVETKGEVDGDEVVITGQKVWTSGAARANKMFVLCRTDPAAEKHAGISFVLIDFKDPAVTYRPMRQMSGAAEFCEDFLDGVRAPLFNVIGGLNNGWRVAMTTLGYERGGSAAVMHLGYQREFWELVETARKRGKTTDPIIRQRLAWAYTQVEIMRFAGLRTLAGLAPGRQPGPEASIDKLFWSEYHKRLGELAIDIEGTDALLRPEGDGYPRQAGRTCSWPAGRAPSTQGRTRSSATSSASARSACPRSRGCGRDRSDRGDNTSAAPATTPGTTNRRRIDDAGPGGRAPADHRGPARRVLRAAQHRAGRSLGHLRLGPVHRGRQQRRRLYRAAAACPPAARDDLRPPGGPQPARSRRARRPGVHPHADQAVESVVEDAAAAGVRNLIVLASGYREVGGDGRDPRGRSGQRRRQHGIVVLGPNSLGFLNTAAKAAPFALTVPPPLTPGPVGIALQSGALASVLLAFARAQAIGVSTVASLGNEAMITTADVIDYLVEDEQTKVICLFLEEIGDPAAFSAAAQRADRAGKPIVAMKVGSSQAGQQAALAHTGAVAGDDAVVDAALRQLNVIRVTSIEDLLTTAARCSATTGGRRAAGWAC